MYRESECITQLITKVVLFCCSSVYWDAHTKGKSEIHDQGTVSGGCQKDEIEHQLRFPTLQILEKYVLFLQSP